IKPNFEELKIVIRDLTDVFMPEFGLQFPVKVFHKKPQTMDDLPKGSIIFIINPQKLGQQEFDLLLRSSSCFVFFTNSLDESTYENNQIKLLLNDKNANQNLGRIKHLNKNIMELRVEKNKKWDIIGLKSSNKQLFNIKDIGYCFIAYPIIAENTLKLDAVFIQEALKAISPKEIIIKYLEIIEDFSNSKVEACNKRNAFQRVFPFYKSENKEYKFHLDPDDVGFLVDILQLESLADKTDRCAEIIGALTAACSYFVHVGHPDSYKLVIEKLMEKQPTGNAKAVKFRYITTSDLTILKRSNAFLYYHLTCRIPNQFTFALFDLFLVETEEDKKAELESMINLWLEYLKKRILDLSLTNEGLIWEFKRDQEIGAMAGTIGLITLYKQACMNEDISAFSTSKDYLSRAVEYAHPGERNRDINYFTQYSLSRIVRTYSSAEACSEIYSELSKLADLYQNRFITEKKYDAFDAMYAIVLVAVSNILTGHKNAIELFNKIGFDWNEIPRIMNETPYVYALYILVGFLFFTPKELLETKLDIKILTTKAMDFFKLNDEEHISNEVMDLIALKFMLAHAWYLSLDDTLENYKIIRAYRKRIADSLIYKRWRLDCENILDACINKEAPVIGILKLIYTIPY
ncbi:MAG TPA: hypothetical protein VHP38_12805, partial [Ruminiclostridium sp.]|nr:hypothetical protein [Ruminiclostridium sp.]